MSDEILRIKKDTITDIADAIRTQLGETDLINPLDMAECILAIQGGGTELPFTADFGSVEIMSNSLNLTIEHSLEEIPHFILVWNDGCTVNVPLSVNLGGCMIIKSDGTKISDKHWVFYSGGNAIVYSMEITRSGIYATDSSFTIEARNDTYCWKPNYEYKWIAIV